MSELTFVITEKPNAAQRIAVALDKLHNPRRMNKNGVPYYEAQRDSRILIVPALGHLYSIAPSKNERNQPLLNYKWVPRYQAEKQSSRFRIWLQTISELAKGANCFIDACDFDIEGSIIGFCILKYACGGKETYAKRMRYSSLTQEDLETAYANLLPHLDFGLVEAGLVRHEIDWLYGINLSKALMSAARSYGKHNKLSTGRVQGPTLEFLAKREKSISRFKTVAFWTIKPKIEIGGLVLPAKYCRKFSSMEEAEAVAEKFEGLRATVTEVKTRKLQQRPPAPFNLGTLQCEAYRLYGYNPSFTSQIAQKLYLDALISYPRTSSQRLPANLDHKKTLGLLHRDIEYKELAAELLAKNKLSPVTGKKVDPAHPAIYPTGEDRRRKLSKAETKIYDLIVHRFMSAYAEASVIRETKATLSSVNEDFVVEGKECENRGWHPFYKSTFENPNIPLPKITKGENYAIKSVCVENVSTRPTRRYNPASLLQKMERENIGTKATRASIIQTLYERKYVQDENMVVTSLGSEVAKILRTRFPSIVSVKFTRQLEERMSMLQQFPEKRENVLKEAIEALKPALADLKANEKVVGEGLRRAIVEGNNRANIIGLCPSCNKGSLFVQVSQKTGKRFVGCTNYFTGECKNTYPLPQMGKVKLTDKKCVSCGRSTVEVWFSRKRHRGLCFNPNCPTRKNNRQPKFTK